MILHKIWILLFLFSFQVFSQEAKERASKVNPLDAKERASKVNPLDATVAMILSGHAVGGSLVYFIEYFEKCSSERYDQAKAAYLHRVDRKNFTKRYKIEIEYSYYKSMSKLMKEMEPSQDLIDKSQSVSVEDLSRAKSEWKVLASRISSVHKKFRMSQQ